jgi:SAM-dependent methyltransferase
VLDTSTPNLARAYDYLLGGGAHFAADRALAGRLLSLYPRTTELLIASRTYLAGSLEQVARQGVGQFADIGCGLPSRPSTHETVRRVAPRSVVAYVDRDPAVIRHASTLVPPGVRVMEGDLAEPEAILDTLSDSAAIDLSRPACLVLAMVLQVLDPPTARAVVGVLVRALAPGSCLIVSVGEGDAGRLPDAVWPGGFTPEDVTSLFGGLDMAPPGVRPGPVLCATGYKPAGLTRG